MSIQKAQLPDLDLVHQISVETITTIYPHYYPKGAVEFFLEHHCKSNIISDLQSGRIFLCFDAKQTPVGTVTLNDNEINRLFVLPHHQNMGFGRELLDFAETTLFQSYSEITLASSLPAKRMYLKRGYQEVESDVIRTQYGDFLCYDTLCKPCAKSHPLHKENLYGASTTE